MEGEYAHVSDDEKLAVATRLLLSSPPGEIRDVAKDVVKLLPAGLLTDAKLRGVLRAYNVKHCTGVMTPEGTHRVVICQAGEVDPTHYIDTKSKKVWGFDHLTQELLAHDVSDCPEKFTMPTEPFRLAVQQALDGYVFTQFANQGAAAVFSTGDNELTIVLSTERINLRNYWCDRDYATATKRVLTSGRWTSQWTLNLDSRVLKGAIDLHVHYYEDGNLQLQSRKAVETTLASTDASVVGAAVVQAIRDEEHVIHSNLEDMYINMSEETFKEMRRVMPVTQTKMEWSIHAHRTAKDLGQK
ncbi:F-actin-capping protein subunit alpha [Achlya hypogyna]|uniref:F-actin-capping protein subunit alpha n=1 Tax=Achlya hypogyna TaxID=1202772 RepID=A0A1V9ZGJ5_ACHHY|nr:F-actin-capping protein subunit alpha [Achlya hypogyna]